MLILAQLPSMDSISKTVTQAIDAGNIGIMVLLAIGLIVLGGIMGVLILRVLVPLLKQVIELTSQVTAMINRTNEAIEHSNETNKLVAGATTEQTGAIQRVDKNIQDMSGKVEVLSLNFGAYQTLQSDTTDQLRAEMVSFKTDIQNSIDQMLESITTSNTFVEKIANDVDQAVKEHRLIIDNGIELLKKADRIIALLPSPSPTTNVVNVNTGAGTEAAQSEAKTENPAA